jgi:hypothetical protein
MPPDFWLHFGLGVATGVAVTVAVMFIVMERLGLKAETSAPDNERRSGGR